jgi:hypothetical protein
MGQRARQAFNVEFDKAIALRRWEELLLEVSGTLPARAANSSVGPGAEGSARG